LTKKHRPKPSDWAALKFHSVGDFMTAIEQLKQAAIAISLASASRLTHTFNSSAMAKKLRQSSEAGRAEAELPAVTR
jgi:hypothetical protein